MIIDQDMRSVCVTDCCFFSVSSVPGPLLLAGSALSAGLAFSGTSGPR